jgi:LDH2 family malate/lactate/ureidoglycolate dehydrogenase
MSNPDEGDEVVGGRPPQEPPSAFDGLNAERNVALNASGADPADSVDALDAENGSGYVAISDEIASVIEKAADAAIDFASFHKELEKLVTGWDPDKIAECIAMAMFKARALGDAEFDRGK